MNRSQALQYIKQLSEKGELEEATHRYALIIVDLILDEGNEELLHCHTTERLSAWIRRDALARQAKLSEEAFAEQFGIGHGNAYGCIEQMLSCIDYEFVLDLLIKHGQGSPEISPSKQDPGGKQVAQTPRN
ncbi:MAG: hypothetical protein CL859_01505 [Cyanobium sp. ARS6]|nr:hypothetical protein [Cyanobium sp. ARS6]